MRTPIFCRWSVLGAGFAAVVLLLGCKSPERHAASTVAYATQASERQAGFTPQQRAWIDDNCPFGMPEKTADFGETKVIPREGYILEHSTARKIALWVEETIKRERLEGPYSRDDLKPREPFRPDDALDAGARAELADYDSDKAEYARGHMSPVGNIKDDLELMSQTYYLSNMVPQDRPMNSGVWSWIEGRTREWAKTCGKIYVITGGFLYDPLEDDAATADGVINYWTIGDNAVTVPTHIFKVVLAPYPPGQWSAICIVLENRSYPNLKLKDIQAPDQIKSIRWLEERTGLNFFPKLPADQADQVENQIPAHLWSPSMN